MLEIKRPVFLFWNMARGPETKFYWILSIGKDSKERRMIQGEREGSVKRVSGLNIFLDEHHSTNTL